jgi:hypothetical protein
MSTSRAFEDVIECIINADGFDPFSPPHLEARRVFNEFKDQQEEESLYEKVNECIPALLHRMHGDLDNERLQQGCMNVLRTLHKAGYGYRVVPVIRSFIQRHPDDPSVVRLGLRVIKGGMETFHHSFITNDFLSCIIDSMLQHEADPVIQVYAMACVEEYMQYGRVHGTLNELRAPRALLQAMHNYPNNSDVQAAACSIINTIFRGGMILEEWPPLTILQAMNSLAHFPKVQVSACNLLTNLGETVLENEEGNEVEARLRTLSGQEYVQATLRAMKNHSNDKMVQSAAMRFLERIMVIESTTSHMVQGGGVELVARASLTIKWPRLGIAILEKLCKSSADARRLAIEGGVIPTLLEHLRRGDSSWRYSKYNHTDIVDARNALNHLFLENVDNAVSLQIASKGGIKLIVYTSVWIILNAHFEVWDDGVLARLAMFPSAEGMLPLHYAASWRHADAKRDGSIAVIEHLLKVYPQAANIRDGSGRLPLHCAIEVNAPLSVIETLLRDNPDTGGAILHCRDHVMLNFPPALMAAACDCDLESIFVLLYYDFPTITKRWGKTTIKRKRKSPTYPRSLF